MNGQAPAVGRGGLALRGVKEDEWVLQAGFDPAFPESLLVETTSAGCRSWTAGEIYRYGALTGTTRECVERFLAGLEAGSARPAELAGHFAIAAWFPGTRSWSFWTDRAGSLHLYYTAHAGRAAIGTFSPAVYSVSGQRLDWTGLAGFFALGFFPADLTHFEGVRIMRPASRYDFDRHGRLVKKAAYWNWHHSPSTARSEEATLEEFGATLGGVLREQLRTGNAALPLSGGLDSRTVAACLPDGRKPLAYSYGYGAGSDETSIAAEVAKAAGIPFTAHEIRPYLLENTGIVMDSVEGFQDLTQARQAAVADWLGEHADFVLAAHWGDVFCDSMGFQEPASGEEQVLDHAIKKLAKRGRRWLLDHVCRPRLNGDDPEQLARDMVRQELRQFAGIADPDFRIKALKTSQWAFRWTLASLRMYQAGAFPRIPFLDPRVIDFFCTVPTEMVRGRRLQIEYLKRYAPQMARIRWQVYDANLYQYQHYGTWLLPRRAWKKFRRLALGEKVLQRNWEIQFFAGGQWPNLERRLLANNRLLHELVGAAAIRALLDEFHRAPGGPGGYTVSMLLTFASWLEKSNARI
jgi:hypothetical protein